jgi:hypothetical protein
MERKEELQEAQCGRPGRLVSLINQPIGSLVLVVSNEEVEVDIKADPAGSSLSRTPLGEFPVLVIKEHMVFNGWTR